MLLTDDEIAARKASAKPEFPDSQTPWQQLYRAYVGGLDSGAVLTFAVKYRGVLRPGEQFHSTTIFAFSTTAAQSES